ncbi:MAG TPA: class I SAM-dependent methyltransferase [Candidatus Binatus sp.]|nr:class I SAM-dependent methyltransferase [Candidatus Binatus sp.]
MTYQKSSEFYDEIYSYKDYKRESEKVHRIIQDHKKTAGRSLLDVACGTGNHIQYLKRRYHVEGLDLNSRMLNIAKKKHPEVKFHRANMIGFDLGKKYDAITCLFSAIGFVKTVSNLNRAIASMARHLHPGGVLVLEPWLSPRIFKTGTLHAILVDKPNIKIARIATGAVKNQRRISLNYMHHLVGTRANGVKYFVERLELGLFTKQNYLDAFHRSGMKVQYDPKGLIGRGLYVGIKT